MAAADPPVAAGLPAVEGVDDEEAADVPFVVLPLLHAATTRVTNTRQAVRTPARPPRPREFSLTTTHLRQLTALVIQGARAESHTSSIR